MSALTPSMRDLENMPPADWRLRRLVVAAWWIELSDEQKQSAEIPQHIRMLAADGVFDEGPARGLQQRLEAAYAPR